MMPGLLQAVAGVLVKNGKVAILMTVCSIDMWEIDNKIYSRSSNIRFS